MTRLYADATCPHPKAITPQDHLAVARALCAFMQWVGDVRWFSGESCWGWVPAHCPSGHFTRDAWDCATCDRCHFYAHPRTARLEYRP